MSFTLLCRQTSCTALSSLSCIHLVYAVSAQGKVSGPSRMDWSSLIPGRNLTNEDLVKELIQEKRLQHPRAVQALLKVVLPASSSQCIWGFVCRLPPCLAGACCEACICLQVDRKFFIRPDMHETDAYQVRLPFFRSQIFNR